MRAAGPENGSGGLSGPSGGARPNRDREVLPARGDLKHLGLESALLKLVADPAQVNHNQGGAGCKPSAWRALQKTTDNL
eukprot:4367822-Pyramimonas_sp.AAC.1